MKAKIILTANIQLRNVLLNCNVKVNASFITSLLTLNKCAATFKNSAKIMRQGYANYNIKMLSLRKKCVAILKMSA